MAHRFSRSRRNPTHPTDPSDPSEQPTVAPSPVRRWTRVGFVVLALALLTWALVEQRDAVRQSLTSLSPLTLVLALVSVLVGLGANMASWRGAMAAVGADLPLRPATRVFFLSQLGKYVPGSVWPVLAQIELTRDNGISRLRGTVGAVVAMVVGVITSGAVAVALLVLPDPAVRERYWWLLVLVPAAAALLHPRVMELLIRLALRVLRRSGPVPTLRAAGLARSVAWSLTMWWAFGLHAWLIARDLAPGAAPGYLTTSGAFALAWVVGFVVFLAPAGLGAREAALALALSGSLTTGQALALAVLSRVVMTVADAVAAGLAVLAARRGESARSGPARPTPLSDGSRTGIELCHPDGPCGPN